jgi:hypothetical protein
LGVFACGFGGAGLIGTLPQFFIVMVYSYAEYTDF